MSSENAKAVAEALTTLWLDEIPATLRVLAAVPDANRDYRPAPKSRSAWELARHMATSDFWFIDSIEKGRFDFNPEAAAQAEARFGSIAEVVAFYEANIPSRLKQLAAMDGAALAEAIDFFGMMNRSRAAWIGYATNHSVHHRGQISAYLRAMGAKVPDIYGPSGDSEPMPEKS
jgi:uncharacterized damage-inducible protein DinB